MSSWFENPDSRQMIERVLGYLNFSEGNQDCKFLVAINHLFDQAPDGPDQPKWRNVLDALDEHLGREQKTNSTFRDCQQAVNIIRFCRDEFIETYKDFHKILLGHHQENELFTQFFTARLLETALTCYARKPELRFDDLRTEFDNYLGFRPIAVLESGKADPYPGEWTRPIPIYISGVGAAKGKYQRYVDHAINMIEKAPSEILLAAQFDLDSLDEIAIDPRSYDFDHPANKRPNYHFGQWDPHLLDTSGYFRRFVVQQVTLDSLASRCESKDAAEFQREYEFEAGAVLAGTILMAASICGRSPDSYDSNTSIALLLPKIAKLRDDFYRWLLSTIRGVHARRLEAEAKEKRQPFGGARQHLNAELANLRESQLEKARLAAIFARMGYPDAANSLASEVHTASARVRTQIECQLTQAECSILESRFVDAADQLSNVFQLVQEGIGCGALVDPWNILGFDAQFSLFPAMENSVPDERAIYLVDIMNQCLSLYSALWSHAAARDEQKLCEQVRQSYEPIVEWWHRFATHEVSNVDAANAHHIFKAAEQVALAMNLWQKEEGEAGRVAFWAKHANLFATPRAYELIVNALFEKDDLATSMALIMHWLSQAETVGLQSAESSFHHIVEQWTFRSCRKAIDDYRNGNSTAAIDGLKLIKKFIDFLEVNADSYWAVPEFEFGDKKNPSSELIIDDSEPDEIYSAAYEDVVYKDSTGDGIDGQLFETDDERIDQLELEANRLEDRLRFHETVARIWELVSPVFAECANGLSDEEQVNVGAGLANWAVAARRKVGDLHLLLHSVEVHKPASGLGDHDSMVEYDRQRYVQEGLMDRIITVTVATRHAMRLLAAGCTAITGKPADPRLESQEVLNADIFAAIFTNRPDRLADQINLLFGELKKQPLLYVPISRNGAPAKIELVKSRQHFIRRLLEILPRFGLIEQTFRLLNVARAMERSHPVGNGAVTEFDELFEIGFRSVVNCLIQSADNDDSTADQRQLLFRWLERFTESSLIVWLKHSRTLRLSILEKVHKKGPWKELVKFIKKYGKDIFTQRFLNFSNIRGILHQGVSNWLETLMEHGEIEWKLLEDIDDSISRTDVVNHLSLILEAMLENHLEYQDYNSTTTQSDQGNQLYMLIDFLRLKIGYDRICWHLRPVFWAHDNLAQARKDQVAKRWRRSLVERIHKKAAKFVRYLERIQRRYAMRMPSVANRILEKFVKPMHIDRIKAFVAPAMDVKNENAETCFELLNHDVEQLIRNPEGSGIKVPAWLASIEEEVACALDQTVNDDSFLSLLVSSRSMPREEVREQLTAIAELSKKKRAPDRNS